MARITIFCLNEKFFSGLHQILKMMQPQFCPSLSQNMAHFSAAQGSHHTGTNSRKKFSSEEDKHLKELVEIHGAKNWDRIAELMPGRTGRQCRDRYRNYLIPGFFNGQWSQEEDDLLRAKYNEFGPQWAKMTPFFNGRSANSLKNRWNYFVCRTDPKTQQETQEQKQVKTPQPITKGITLPPKFRFLSTMVNNAVKVEVNNV